MLLLSNQHITDKLLLPCLLRSCLVELRFSLILLFSSTTERHRAQTYTRALAYKATTTTKKKEKTPVLAKRHNNDELLTLSNLEYRSIIRIFLQVVYIYRRQLIQFHGKPTSFIEICLIKNGNTFVFREKTHTHTHALVET